MWVFERLPAISPTCLDATFRSFLMRRDTPSADGMILLNFRNISGMKENSKAFRHDIGECSGRYFALFEWQSLELRNNRNCSLLSGSTQPPRETHADQGPWLVVQRRVDKAGMVVAWWVMLWSQKRAAGAHLVLQNWISRRITAGYGE